jgi:hypothetical protein
MKLTNLVLNFKFNINIIFMINYSFSEGDVPVDSETLLTIDFVNLKIKSTQSFTCAHMGRMCVHIFIGVIAHRGRMRVYVNLKIKSTQFFSAHMDRICVHVFIGVSARTYINIYMYISKKNKSES